MKQIVNYISLLSFSNSELFGNWRLEKKTNVCFFFQFRVSIETQTNTTIKKKTPEKNNLWTHHKIIITHKSEQTSQKYLRCAHVCCVCVCVVLHCSKISYCTKIVKFLPFALLLWLLLHSRWRMKWRALWNERATNDDENSGDGSDSGSDDGINSGSSSSEYNSIHWSPAQQHMHTLTLSRPRKR